MLVPLLVTDLREERSRVERPARVHSHLSQERVQRLCQFTWSLSYLHLQLIRNQHGFLSEDGNTKYSGTPLIWTLLGQKKVS